MDPSIEQGSYPGQAPANTCPSSSVRVFARRPPTALQDKASAESDRHHTLEGTATAPEVGMAGVAARAHQLVELPSGPLCFP